MRVYSAKNYESCGSQVELYFFLQVASINFLFKFLNTFYLKTLIQDKQLSDKTNFDIY